jgi:LPS-assembly lipoprotein
MASVRRATMAPVHRQSLASVRRALLAALVALPLCAGCGFHLRGAASYTVQTIFVNATGSPPMGVALRRALADTGSARPVDDPKAAQVILDVPIVVDDKEVLSLSQSGAVREYQLVKRASFRLHYADGNDWLPAGEVTVRRAYTFNESEVLARDAQEQRLLREMQQDIVQQLIRRLEAAHKP